MANEEKKTSLVKFDVNGEEVKLSAPIVRNYLVNGNADVTDQEVVMFINLCKFQKLNPFLNEAYLVKFKSKTGDGKAQIITSKEAYMKKAERAHGFDGFEAGIIVERDGKIVEEEGSFSIKGDVLLGGWCKAYKKDRSRPYVAKIGLDEYNKGQSTWNKMPKTMIRKTAIVQALREAFPEDLGALYVEEEAGQIHSTPEHDVEMEIKEKANKKTISMDQKDSTKEEPKQEPKTDYSNAVEVEYEEASQQTMEPGF